LWRNARVLRRPIVEYQLQSAKSTYLTLTMSTGLPQLFKDTELDTTATLGTSSDLVAPNLPTSMQESSDGGSAVLLWNTGHNPQSAGVRDHVSPAQSDHHEEGRTRLLLITGRPLVSHPQNAAKSRHSNTLVLEQEHLPDSLKSTGPPQMFKDPELDTAISDTSSDLVAPTLSRCDPSLNEQYERRVRLLESELHQAKLESHEAKLESHQVRSELRWLEAELNIIRLAESSHRRNVDRLKNELEEQETETAQLRQELVKTLREKEAESGKREEELRRKDEQIMLRDWTIRELQEEKNEELPQIYEKIAQMERSIQELKEQTKCKGKRKRMEAVSKGYVLGSQVRDGKQVINIKEVIE